MSEQLGDPPNALTNPPGPATARDVSGERRVITVLFCDVVGSTSLASRFDPEEWAEVMNEAFRFMIAPVEEYGGTVARLMGDAVLAFFGAPLAHEDDPQRAVLAGLGIINGIQSFIAQFRDDYGWDFNVRVGINTGPVVVGEIGGGQTGEYTAMGDAINVAARMEQTAAPGTVQIAEDTWRHVAPLFDVRDLGRIEVKGKDQPVQAYCVLGAKVQSGRLRGLEDVPSPLVGREREIGRLRDILAGLRDGQSRICYLVGEAGLGKSRLIDELHRSWDEQPAVAGRGASPWHGWVEFAAVSYGANRPYDLIKRQLRAYCGIRESDPPAVIHERLGALVNALPPALHERMHRLFGFLLGDTTADPGQGENFQRELRTIMEQMTRAQAARGPLVYVVDDAHWADVASLETLHNLLPLVRARPMLFLFAMRPDRDTPGRQLHEEIQVEFPEYATSIYLEPLTAADGHALVREMLQSADAPERVYELIERKAEGNPFFIEETVRALLDSGALRPTGDGFRWDSAVDADRVAELIGLPGNVQALLTARIDQLDQPVRRTLQLASVIGRTFPLPVLERIADHPAELLHEHLRRLAQADLVRPSLSGDGDEYAFRHALTRDAAYGTILIRQRRRYHRRVAEAMESLYAERLPEEAPQLAWHYIEALDWARAIRYCAMAGAAAARLYANVEAIEHYSRALEIARANPSAVDDAGLTDIFHRLGRVYEVAGQPDNALRAYQTLEQLGAERDNPTLQLEGLMPQVVLFVTPTPFMDAARGREHAERLMALGEQLGRVDAQARAQWCLMLLYMNAAPDAARAVDHGERALALARDGGYTEIEGYVLNDIGRAYDSVGRTADGTRAFADARALWQATGNEPMLADVLGMEATQQILYGDLPHAVELARQGMDVSRRIGNLWGMALNGYALGSALVETGEIGEGARTLASSMEWAEQANFVGLEASVPVVLSWLFGTLGRYDYQHESLERALAEVTAEGSMAGSRTAWELIRRHFTGDAAGAYEMVCTVEPPPIVSAGQEAIFIGMIIPEILVSQARFDEALAAADAMLRRMAALGVRAMRADLLTIRGRALAGLGRDDEAAAEWRAALIEAREQGSRRAEWPALVRLVEVEGDAARVESYRQEAAVVLRFILDHLDDDELRAAFLLLPDVGTLIGT